VLKRPEVNAQNPLATKALGALRNLAFDAENAAEAVREGGIQLALKLIGQYGATDDLQEAACGALSNMAAPEPEYRRLAVAEGLYPAVTKILLRPRILPDGLRGAAAGALAVAAAEPGTERSAAANDLVKAAAECLAKPGASESLALAALAIIRGMAGAAAAAADGGITRKHAVQGGGMSAAVRALWRRSASLGLLTAANGAVSALLKDPEGPGAAVRDGAAAGLAAAMKREVTTPQLRLSLARTLKVVLDAAPPGGGVAAGLSGIHDALAQAKADPASSPELVSLAETLAKQLPPPPVDLAAEQE